MVKLNIQLEKDQMAQRMCIQFLILVNVFQYLNFMNVDYDKNTFYKFLALNRFLRYKKCIELIKNKTFLDNKPYLFLH